MALTIVDVPTRFSDHLIPTERVVFAVRRHLAQVAEPVGSFVASVVVVLWLEYQLPRDLELLPQLLWAPPVVLLARALWALWEWQADWFVVTDRRLMLGYGVFTRRVAMMPMGKVTDMSYNRSVLGRILGFGEFVLESAGQDQAMRVVSWLPDPDHLYRLICIEIFGPDDDWHDTGPVPVEEPAERPAPKADRVPSGRSPASWTGFSLGPPAHEGEASERDQSDVLEVEDGDAIDDDADWDDEGYSDDEGDWDDEGVVEDGAGHEAGPAAASRLRRIDPRRWARRRARRRARWDD